MTESLLEVGGKGAEFLDEFLHPVPMALTSFTAWSLRLLPSWAALLTSCERRVAPSPAFAMSLAPEACSMVALRSCSARSLMFSIDRIIASLPRPCSVVAREIWLDRSETS